MKTFCRVVDSLNQWVGRVSAWLILPLTLIVAMDVVLRYVFNRPTIWSWDITVQLLGVLTMLSGGYVLLVEGHVIVDVFTTRWSRRRRAIIDLMTSAFFFFAIGVMIWACTDAAWSSLKARETFPSFYAAPIYQLKIIIVFGALLLFLQGVVKFIHDLNIVLYGKEDSSK